MRTINPCSSLILPGQLQSNPFFKTPSLIYYAFRVVLSVLTDFGVCLRIRALDITVRYLVEFRLKTVDVICGAPATLILGIPFICYTIRSIPASLYSTRLTELLVLTDFGVCLPVERVGCLFLGTEWSRRMD